MLTTSLQVRQTTILENTPEKKFTGVPQRELPSSSRAIDVNRIPIEKRLVSMSDAAKQNLENMGRKLLKQSQHTPLEARMKAFLAEHQVPNDLKEARERVAAGKPVSDLVSEGRDERF
jgi:hypothetical protein